MERRNEMSYITFLKHIARLRDSLSYVSATNQTSYDPLSLAAVYELRRLDDEDS